MLRSSRVAVLLDKQIITLGGKVWQLVDAMVVGVMVGAFPKVEVMVVVVVVIIKR